MYELGYTLLFTEWVRAMTFGQVWDLAVVPWLLRERQYESERDADVRRWLREHDTERQRGHVGRAPDSETPDPRGIGRLCV